MKDSLALYLSLHARVCVCVCETKRRRDMLLHTTVYGTSNTATLRIQMSHNIQKWNTVHSIQINWKIIIIL